MCGLVSISLWLCSLSPCTWSCRAPIIVWLNAPTGENNGAEAAGDDKRGQSIWNAMTCLFTVKIFLLLNKKKYAAQEDISVVVSYYLLFFMQLFLHYLKVIVQQLSMFPYLQSKLHASLFSYEVLFMSDSFSSKALDPIVAHASSLSSPCKKDTIRHGDFPFGLVTRMSFLHPPTLPLSCPTLWLMDV